MVAYLNVIGAFDETFLSNKVLRSGLVEFFFLVKHLFLKEIKTLTLFILDSNHAHRSLADFAHLQKLIKI